MSEKLHSNFQYFLVNSPCEYVVHVQINRPEKYNSFVKAMWVEFDQIFDQLSLDPNVRAIVLSGAGDKAFTSGLDVQTALSIGAKQADVSRTAFGLREVTGAFQKCIASTERCQKPVICVMHGFSYGLAIDIASCTDVRICAKNTKFSVKEVDIGLAADIGTLTRLPKIVGSHSWVKDVSLTARIFGAEEAFKQGFVSQVHESKEKAVEAGLNLAQLIATKSPVAVLGTKELLNHARDHTVAESLRYTTVWASAAVQSADIAEATLSGIQKRKPTFEKL
ncbi:MAG: hypothetical protein M1818_006457 [Claussenomyces sp. TS43310]|nr:MAG: hypothetical protein M1818_006457 [Claussenomyces sp. TS43310]